MPSGQVLRCQMWLGDGDRWQPVGPPRFLRTRLIATHPRRPPRDRRRCSQPSGECGSGTAVRHSPASAGTAFTGEKRGTASITSPHSSDHPYVLLAPISGAEQLDDT